jgi:hypothetical protein
MGSLADAAVVTAATRRERVSRVKSDDKAEGGRLLW